MKNITFILILLLFSSCKNNFQENFIIEKIATTENKAEEIKDSITKPKEVIFYDRSAYHTKEDSVIIETCSNKNDVGYAKYVYSRDEFNAIVDRCPQLTSDKIIHPLDAYSLPESNKDFGALAFQPSYYNLYAYFLKKKNGENYKEEREKLRIIGINSGLILEMWSPSADGHGRYLDCVAGDVEYHIYKYKKLTTISNDFQQRKNKYLEKQKQLLKEGIAERLNEYASGHLTPKEAKKMTLEGIRLVNELDKVITNDFYLEFAIADE